MAKHASGNARLQTKKTLIGGATRRAGFSFLLIITFIVSIVTKLRNRQHYWRCHKLHKNTLHNNCDQDLLVLLEIDDDLGRLLQLKIKHFSYMTSKATKISENFVTLSELILANSIMTFALFLSTFIFFFISSFSL